MTFGDAVSEQNIKVEFDPRLHISKEAINQKYMASKELESYQEKITAIVKQLVESKNAASSIKDQLSKEGKKKYKTEIKASTEIIKKIDTLIAFYLGRVDKRQGITRNKEVTVNQRFGLARSYVSSRFGEQTATEIQLIRQFKEAFRKVLSKTNSFFNKEWINYKSSTEKIYISPFKETKIYSIK
jgi:predicted RNase H-like nuclease (RuvC/YqgF family)